MYSKFGRIKNARQVFDEMSERNSASVNNMVSGYVKSRSYVDAFMLFVEMLTWGIEVSGFLVASLLTACCRSKDLVSEGLQLHSMVLKNGLLDDVYVGTSLLHFYGGYGFLSLAQRVFEDMPERNVVSWTSFMVGFADNGDHAIVIDAYRRMRHEGIVANQNTFTTVVCSSCALGDEFLGHQVLGHVVKSGFEGNTSVANSLVFMFDTYGRVREACSVFDELDERDTISWNSIVAAYAHNLLLEQSFRCFRVMRCDHGEINATTFCSLVSVSSALQDLKWGRGVHGLAVKMGVDSNICFNNTLLTMYCETGRTEEAERLFEKMKERDLISWNSLMAGYESEGRRFDALRLLTDLLNLKKFISYVTFASALAACSDPEFTSEGRAVHALALIFGFQENLIVGNALVTMYGRCGTMAEARKVFQTMHERELVTWNALIGGYAENEEPDDAVNTFKFMLEDGEPANYITMTNILGACSAPSKLLELGKPLHSFILQAGFETNEYVKNSLITMYANCGDLGSSKLIFDELVYKTSATWNAMIAANAHQGYGEESLKVLREMQRATVPFDQFSLSASMAVSADLASLEEGKQLHGVAVKLGLNSYHYVENSIMDMYGKCGELDDVLKLLPEPLQSRLSWNILISSFARHGLFEKASRTFHEMVKSGSDPDHVTFVSLLSACSHGGLVDEGLSYFNKMTSDFGVKPGIEHCVCIVDLLGRSGRFPEAEAFIAKMPVPPNDFIWRSLLASCRIHGNMDVGERAAQRLLEFDPSDDSAYVLYSNVCSASGKWQDAQNTWMGMESNSIRKKPAFSWVKRKAEVHTFGIGDLSHPMSEQIYTKLSELRKKINEAGYVADTSFALQDTDAEQKEHNLWNHSERLALAYGLISTPDSSTLRVFKNLRVCGDCHSVYKFVSSIVQREIVLRDPYRFHHFKNGVCSCGDYW